MLADITDTEFHGIVEILMFENSTLQFWIDSAHKPAWCVCVCGSGGLRAHSRPEKARHSAEADVAGLGQGRCSTQKPREAQG